jgi:hypothetical protein
MAKPKCDFTALSWLPPTFRLFNHVLPIDVVHPRTGRDAAQPLGLGLAPAEDVAVVEVVGHGGLLRP